MVDQVYIEVYREHFFKSQFSGIQLVLFSKVFSKVNFFVRSYFSAASVVILVPCLWLFQHLVYLEIFQWPFWGYFSAVSRALCLLLFRLFQSLSGVILATILWLFQRRFFSYFNAVSGVILAPFLEWFNFFFFEVILALFWSYFSDKSMIILMPYFELF